MLTRFNPVHAKKVFFLVQLGVLLLAVVLLYLLRRKKEASVFRVREADRSRTREKSDPDRLAQAKMKRVEPLRLSGIRIDGEPHEVLGVSRSATAEEIQKAYRDLMKKYHPDIVGRPGTREWADAQKIAEAINHARNRMIAAQPQSPKRSGR